MKGASCLKDPVGAAQCRDALLACDFIAGGSSPTLGNLAEKLAACELTWFVCMSNCDANTQTTTGPKDPNEKYVVAGKFIPPTQSLVYPIHFENVGTAEAQDVFVEDVLDPNLDLSTLQLLTPGAILDPASRTVKWSLLNKNLQPSASDDVLLSIKPIANVPSGTAIHNTATIRFEVFSPMSTNTTENIIDSTKPTSHVLELAVTQSAAEFSVRWLGSDTGSGINNYTVYVSDNGGPFSPWLINTMSTESTYTGVIGHTYRFYSIARDAAGNTEPSKNVAEATTVVSGGVPGDVNGDGVVNCADIAIVKAAIGTRTGDPGFNPAADVNSDGVVDVRDLAFVSQQLPAGTKCQ